MNKKSLKREIALNVMEKELLPSVVIVVMEMEAGHVLHVIKKESFHVSAKEVMTIARNVKVQDGDLVQMNGVAMGLKCVGHVTEEENMKKLVQPVMVEELFYDIDCF